MRQAPPSSNAVHRTPYSHFSWIFVDMIKGQTVPLTNSTHVGGLTHHVRSAQVNHLRVIMLRMWEVVASFCVPPKVSYNLGEMSGK